MQKKNMVALQQDLGLEIYGGPVERFILMKKDKEQIVTFFNDIVSLLEMVERRGGKANFLAAGYVKWPREDGGGIGSAECKKKFGTSSRLSKEDEVRLLADIKEYLTSKAFQDFLKYDGF